MKFISNFRLFEENIETIENYFKDKINWKMYNDIIEYYTKYEDVGYEFSIQIGYTSYVGHFISIYNSETNYYGEDGLQRLIYFYNRPKPMEYHVCIRHENATEHKELRDKLVEICEKLKNKYNIDYKIYDDYEDTTGKFKYCKALIEEKM